VLPSIFRGGGPLGPGLLLELGDAFCLLRLGTSRGYHGAMSREQDQKTPKTLEERMEKIETELEKMEERLGDMEGSMLAAFNELRAEMVKLRDEIRELGQPPSDTLLG